MNQQDLFGALTGDRRYRVTPFMVEVADASGRPVETIDRNDIKEVQRKGNVVTVKRRKGKDVALEGATVDDAGRLELALRGPAMAFPAGAPPLPAAKKGGGIGRFFLFGCGGLLALVVLVIVLVAIAASGGSKNDNSGGSGSNAAATPGQVGTNKGDVHVSLTEGSSGIIAPEGNDNKRSKVTIMAIKDPATSSNQFEKPAQGKKFWAVQVEVENVGTAETTGLDWKLRDSKNQELTQSFVSGVGESLRPGSLTPGGKTSGWLVFQIDADASPKWLRADPNPFLKNDLYFDAPGQ